MPTIDTNYSCYLTNCMGSRPHHIMPLVINSLGGRHTHTHTHTHTNTHAYRHSWTEAILRNRACAWFKNGVGINHCYIKSKETRSKNHALASNG